MESLPSSITSSGALLEMKLLRAHADLRTQTPVGPGCLFAGPQVIPMAFKVENFPVDVTVGAVMAQKRTGIHSGASWRDSPWRSGGAYGRS